MGSLVLCYHALSNDGWPAALSTTPARLERQLHRLVGRGYRGATFSAVVRAAPDERLLAVTFDDAFLSVYTLARPILTRLGLPGTVFVPTDFIDREPLLRWDGIDQWLSGRHERELTPMTWEQLRELAAEGWEIGSHTGSHPHLTRLSDRDLDDELARSRRACEQALGRPCTSLAYPYGDVDDRVVAATGRAGYVAAAALPRRLEPGDALRWPRVGVYHDDDDRRFALKVSPALRALRGSRAWERIDGVRRRLRA